MRILLIQESDWIERNPHQQHHLMEILSAKGHEIRVIDHGIDWRRKDKKRKGLYMERKTFPNYHKINPEANITVIRPAIIQIPIVDYLSILRYHWKEINLQIKEFKPDVIVAFGLLNAYIGSKIAKEHGIPFVYYLIDVLYALIPEKSLRPIGKFLKKRTIKNSTKVIAINRKLAQLAMQLGAEKDKTEVIGAGIYLKDFDPDVDGSSIRAEYGIKDEDIVLFYMGWIYHFSGLKELAESLGKTKTSPNIKLLIVGDGDAFDDLHNIQYNYGLYDQLILAGKQPFKRIPEFIAASDICILPAYPDEEIMQDIVPIKLYEYMAMGKPVITTKLPGIMMEFRENNGIVYVDKPQDVLDMVLKLVSENSIIEIGKKARKFVEYNDWKQITADFEQSLQNLLK